MNRAIVRRIKSVDAASLLDELSRRQYLFPRKPLVDVLTEVAAVSGLTLTSVRSATNRFELDTTRSIGRLKRVELEYLSRLIHRAYRQELSSVC